MTSELITHRLRDSLDGVTIWETWFVSGLPWSDTGVDSQALFGMPAKGAPSTRPGFERAILVDRDVTEWLDPTQAFVTLRYDSNRAYSGGPVANSKEHGVTLYVEVPVWYQTAIPGGSGPFNLVYVRVPRRAVERTETRFLAGDHDTRKSVHDAVARWAGALFVLDGTAYILADHGMFNDSNGQMRVEYVFQIPAAMKGGPAGNNPYNSGKLVPDLLPLEEWRADTVNTATIKKTVTDLYIAPTDPSSALPGLYPIP